MASHRRYFQAAGVREAAEGGEALHEADDDLDDRRDLPVRRWRHGRDKARQRRAAVAEEDVRASGGGRGSAQVEPPEEEAWRVDPALSRRSSAWEQWCERVDGRVR